MTTAAQVNGKSITAVIYDVPTASKVADISAEGEGLPFPEVISFAYYESLYEPFMRASITIADSSGKIDKAFNNCGVRQYCAVEVFVKDPTIQTEYERERPELTFSGYNLFFVDRVVNQLIEGKKKIYTLELITRDSLLSLSTTIKSAWPPDNTTKIDYNTVVDDILVKYIKTYKNKGPVMEEMTETVGKIMGNNMKPYQLINQICSKATPKASNSGGKEETRPAGYLFYETYDEYRFDSIHKLITGPVNFNGDHSIYSIKPVNDSDTGRKEASYVIVSYKFYDGTNQSSLLEEVLSAKRGKPAKNVLDVQRNVFKKIEKLPPKTIEDKCLKSASDEDFTPVTYTQQTEYQIEYYNTCDETALDNEPTNPELTSMNYGALLDMLKSKTSTVRIPGNLSLSCGDHIYIDFPLIQGEGAKQTESSTKYSGYYLITQLVHKVEDIRNVYTELEICKLVEA